MFETAEKKQVFANWLWKVANADGNIVQEEKQIINNIALSLGMAEVKYQEIETKDLDIIEASFLLRELYRLAISDKNFISSEKEVIQKFIDMYGLNSNIVSATKEWANNYLANEKKYFETMEVLL